MLIDQSDGENSSLEITFFEYIQAYVNLTNTNWYKHRYKILGKYLMTKFKNTLKINMLRTVSFISGIQGLFNMDKSVCGL